VPCRVGVDVAERGVEAGGDSGFWRCQWRPRNMVVVVNDVGTTPSQKDQSWIPEWPLMSLCNAQRKFTWTVGRHEDDDVFLVCGSSTAVITAGNKGIYIYYHLRTCVARDI
jgi:hypothetical protein